jgi:hypothetical protein
MVERANDLRDGNDGKYVRTYDPDYGDGLGRVWGTDDPSDAILFESVGKALEFWRQPSTVKPLREDGNPNRPLTAFTIEMVPVEVTE